MFGIIIGLIAGFLTPHADSTVARPVAAQLRRFIEVSESEMRVLSVIIMGVLAGAASVFLHSSNAFWVALAVGVGYFGTRLMDGARKGMDNRKAD